MQHRSVNALGPAGVQAFNGICGDYPLRLVTKRTMAYESARIVVQRGTAPQRLRHSYFVRGTGRPPC